MATNNRYFDSQPELEAEKSPLLFDSESEGHNTSLLTPQLGDRFQDHHSPFLSTRSDNEKMEMNSIRNFQETLASDLLKSSTDEEDSLSRSTNSGLLISLKTSEKEQKEKKGKEKMEKKEKKDKGGVGIRKSHHHEEHHHVDNKIIKWLYAKIDQLPLVDPKSELYHYFTMLLIVFILYNTLSIPIRIGFKDVQEEGRLHSISTVFYVLDYFGDFLYWIDILLNFRLVFMEHGMVHTRTDKIFQRYFWGWGFWWDLASALPYGLFSFDILIHAVLRIPRLLKVGRAHDYFSNWQLNTKYGYSVAFVQAVFQILVYLHWETCLYVGISYLSGFSDEDEAWTPDSTFLHRSFWSLYLAGFFWSVKVTTGLGGEVTPPTNDGERAFTTVSALGSLLISGYIIGKIVTLISNMNANEEEFRNKLANINLYMKNKRLPEKLSKKIRDYYNHLWSRQGGIDDSEILAELPPRLRNEVSMEINSAILSKVDFFNKCSPGFLHALVEVLKPEIYLPGDEIITSGDVGTEMYFTNQGSTEVIVNGRTVTELGEGTFFGEIALLFEQKRTATIRAKSYCDLCVLRKTDLDKVLKSFPEQRELIVEMGFVRISKDSLSNTLKREPLFTEIEPFHDFKVELFSHLSYQHFEANQIVYSFGDQPEFLWFCGCATYDLLDSKGKVYKKCTVSADTNEGNFVGEVDFVLNKPHRDTFRMTVAGVLLKISREGFRKILKKFPDAVPLIAKAARIKESDLIENINRVEEVSKTEKKKDEAWLQKFINISSNANIGKKEALRAIQMLSENLKD